jgi:hypothetical protein
MDKKEKKEKKEMVWLLSEADLLEVGGKPIAEVPFQKASVSAGDVNQDRLAVIVNDHDVWTFAAGKWQQEVSTDVDLNCVCLTADNRILVGTERARLASVDDGKLNFIESFDAVPERKLWTTPWGGPPDTRSLAISTDGTIYANIHVGWIVRSKDGGKTWKNLREGLEMDVHQVATHPLHAEIVFAATQKGFHISYDHGDSFSRRSEGMPYHYQRACACLAEGNVYLVSTSRGPRGGDALLYRSEDEGKHWSLVQGLPDKINHNIDTYQIIVVGGSQALVIVENSVLYETDDWGLSWKEVGRDYPRLFGALVST